MTVFLLLLVSSPAFASISVRRSTYAAKKVDVYIVREKLTDALCALEMYLPKRVETLIGEDPVVTYRAKEVAPEAALRGIVKAAKIELVEEEERYWVHNAGELSVNLDVKDGEARDILKSMQRQCGIRNLMIDPEVKGTGTFLFTDIPCRQAFDVVLRTFGLAAQTYSNSVIRVETQH
ncbi:MAG TPA: hypothetical protein VLU46_13780 [Thermoanaerobaculia bacterium]|nr:hypothetical protein [Thermoanaerobaculia bacterium]